MKLIRNVFPSLLLMIFTGCVETITMDPEEENLPVMVNCLLSPDLKVQTLYLQYVKGKSAEDYVPVIDAEVYITAEFFPHRTDTLFFHYVEGNKWESQDTPGIIIEGGKQYSLFVKIPGRDLIRAETTCPVAFRPECRSEVYESHYSIYFELYIDLRYKGKEIYTCPVWVFAKGKHKKYEECDEYYPYLVTDHPYADDFNINGLKFKDLSLDGEFDGHCMQISWPAFMDMRRMMPDLPLHDDFVRIEHLDAERFHLLAGPLEYPKTGEPHQDYFLFKFVSKEYDKYLRSVYVKKRKLEHDLTAIYSTEDIYSNIEGGVGIFGSEINCREGFMMND